MRPLLLSLAALLAATPSLVSATSRAFVPSPASAEEAREVHVSARRGDDATADGSSQKPWRSLSRALEATAGDRPLLVHLDIGDYDASHGESFPLVLEGEIRIRGLTSDYTRIDAGGTERALRLDPQGGRLQLEDLGLRGAELAMEIGGAGGEVLLSDVQVNEVRRGLHFERPPSDEPPSEPLHLQLRSCRLRASEVGLRYRARPWSSVHMEDTRIDGGALGIDWIDLPGASAEPSAEGSLALTRCWIAGCGEAGLRRSGESARPLGELRIEGGCFRDCGTGVRLDAPCGSAPTQVDGVRFHSNQSVGLRLVGGEATDRPFLLRDCEFRWNGVGLQVLTPRNAVLGQRLRFVDNLGAGVSLGCLAPDPAPLRLESSLLADNGAAGVLALSDGHHLAIELRHCTIVANHGHGLNNVSKRRGTSSWSVEDCILAHNDAGEVEALGPEVVRRSLLSRRPEGEAWKELAEDLWIADPGFVAAGDRRWELRPDSVARGRAGHRDATQGPELDLRGRAIPATGGDLGALQSPR